MHINGFKTELYREHLEEAGFQYETRCLWLNDEELSWLELGDIDFAIEAHLDALVLGGAFALKVALEVMPEAESGELHIIVRLFCRHKLIDRLSRLWKTLDFDDKDKTTAVADALKWECPQDWVASLVKVFTTSNAQMFPVLAPAVASFSRSQPHVLLEALSKTRKTDLVEVLTAISRCEPLGSHGTILVLFADTLPDSILEQALITVMVRGESSVIKQVEGQHQRFPIPFALAGSVEDSRSLIELVQRGVATADVLLAVGLAGNLECIVPLLGYLKHPDLSEHAARALWLLSGAQLYEDVYVPEDLEEADLFEHEIESFRAGERPKNIDELEYGVEVRKLSTDYQVWFSWFQENRAKFIAGNRYRNGNIVSPLELVRNMVEAAMPFRIRQLAYQELQIRYSLSLPFLPDDLLLRQKEHLNAIHAWAVSTGNTEP